MGKDEYRVLPSPHLMVGGSAKQNVIVYLTGSAHTTHRFGPHPQVTAHAHRANLRTLGGVLLGHRGQVAKATLSPLRLPTPSLFQSQHGRWSGVEWTMSTPLARHAGARPGTGDESRCLLAEVMKETQDPKVCGRRSNISQHPTWLSLREESKAKKCTPPSPPPPPSHPLLPLGDAAPIRPRRAATGPAAR